LSPEAGRVTEHACSRKLDYQAMGIIPPSGRVAQVWLCGGVGRLQSHKSKARA
jgi:hypothetical protein